MWHFYEKSEVLWNKTQICYDLAASLQTLRSLLPGVEARGQVTEHQVMKLACCSLTVTGCLLSSRATALSSPDMILGVTGGGALVVITWVATGALFYVKVVVAGMCHVPHFGLPLLMRRCDTNLLCYQIQWSIASDFIVNSTRSRMLELNVEYRDTMIHDTPQGQPREIVIKRVGLKIDVFRFQTMKPSSQ